MSRPVGSKNKKKEEPVILTTFPTPEPIKVIDFDKLQGLKASLYYNNELNRFQLGDVVFEVIEDEQDGYRSSMKEVQIIDLHAKRIPGNFLGPVVIQKFYEQDYDGYHIIDEHSDHTWLAFGTSNTDDYYPSFQFNFTPKPDPLENLKTVIK